MILLETMMAGLPPVAFDCPTGPAEIIDDGVTGLLAPAEDVEALAARICELIEEPDRRRAMGAAARRGVEPYSMPAVRQRWERLFADLATARDTHPGGGGDPLTDIP
jgi:glycosyltransferase involved in cell wall biosynthesis